MRRLLCFVLFSVVACAQVTVTVNPSSITGQPTLVVPLKGTATSSAAIVSWSWNYGDGFTCISPNFCGMSVTHYYSKLGQYNVIFSATDANGKTASASMVVTVQLKQLSICPSSDPAKIPGTFYTLPPLVTALTFTGPTDVIYYEDKWGKLTTTNTNPLDQWLASGYVGQSYCTFLEAGGGTPPYTFGATGLPPGLDLVATTGQILGVLTTAGVFPVTFTVTDSLKAAAVPVVRSIAICRVGASCNGFGQ